MRKIQSKSQGILGVGSSIIYEIICTILKKENGRKEDDITFQMKDVSTILEKSVQELGGLQTELEERVKKVEKLKEEAEQAETIISLTEDQVKAVRITLNSELQREGRKSFWQGVRVNFIFFVLELS